MTHPPFHQRPAHFVGREDDLRAVLTRLREKRAVLIQGVSGVGKTELAKEAARWLAARRRVASERVAFVDLSQVTQARDARQAIALALGLPPETADAALARYEEALRLFRAVGDRLGEANTLAALSRLALQRGKDEEARALLQQAIALHQAFGSQYGVATDLYNFGVVLRSLGRPEEARTYLLQAAEIYERINLPHRAAQARQAPRERGEVEEGR